MPQPAAYAYCTGDPVNAYDPTGAVTDVEADAWYHYYNRNAGTAGDRAQAQARTEEVRAGSTGIGIAPFLLTL